MASVGLGLSVLFRFFLEPHLAGIRAEIVGLAFVHACTCRLFFIDVHSTYWIFCHNLILLIDVDSIFSAARLSEIRLQYILLYHSLRIKE